MKRIGLWVVVSAVAITGGAATGVVQDVCGPFTDVSPAFCPYVLEMYYLGITAGTSPTTYSPDNPVTRGQAAVFVSKGVNQAIARSSRRPALGQSWTSTSYTWLATGLGLTPLSGGPIGIACDGVDVWILTTQGLDRVRASDGKLLENWPVPTGRYVLVAMGRVFTTGGYESGSSISMIDPSQAPGPPAAVATGFEGVSGIAFDGARIWVPTLYGNIHLINPGNTLPWDVTTVETGANGLSAVVFDGAHMWAASYEGTLLKLDPEGSILQTVDLGVGAAPESMAFDGANFWVPNEGSNVVERIRVSDGARIGAIPVWRRPYSATFDGERVLVLGHGAHTPETLPSLRVFRAADGALIQYDIFAPDINDAASDGVNFWMTTNLYSGELARF